MTLELTDNGYGSIMEQVQKLESLAWEGLFPDKARQSLQPDLHSHQTLQEIVSESRRLRRIIQENLLIVPKAAAPDGPAAA